jgi:hypothetical protein
MTTYRVKRFVTALALLLTACGGTTAQTSGSGGTTASQPGSLAEDITFSGPVNGHLASAAPNTCHFVLNDQSLGTFVGQLNNKALSFTVFVPLYNAGPGSYGPQPYSEQGVTFSLGGVGYRTRNNAQNASVDPSDFTIVVAGDEKSGSVSARLGLYNSADGSVGALSETVTGRWRCG